MRLKKDDTVKIIAGKDKGLTGKIVKVDPVKERVIVQGANMVKKTMKKQNAQDKGGIVEVEDPCFKRSSCFQGKRFKDRIQDGKRKESPLCQEDR